MAKQPASKDQKPSDSTASSQTEQKQIKKDDSAVVAQKDQKQAEVVESVKD